MSKDYKFIIVYGRNFIDNIVQFKMSAHAGHEFGEQASLALSLVDNCDYYAPYPSTELNIADVRMIKEFIDEYLEKYDAAKSESESV